MLVQTSSMMLILEKSYFDNFLSFIDQFEFVIEL